MATLKELRKKYISDYEAVAQALRRTSDAAHTYARLAKEDNGEEIIGLQVESQAGAQRRGRPPRDPSKPKEPHAKSAYMLFKEAVKSNFSKGDVSNADFAKSCQEAWKGLDDAGKKPYIVAAEGYKRDHDKAMKADEPPPAQPKAAPLPKKAKAVVEATMTQSKHASPKKAAPEQPAPDDTESESEATDEGVGSSEDSSSSEEEDSFDIRSVKPAKQKPAQDDDEDELSIDE